MILFPDLLGGSVPSLTLFSSSCMTKSENSSSGDVLEVITGILTLAVGRDCSSVASIGFPSKHSGCLYKQLID